MAKKKPVKAKNVLEIIKKCIEEDRYTMTIHALYRKNERNINFSEIVHVLKTGYEEKKKTIFEDKKNAWNYAIRGKTKIDDLDIRVIVSFDDSGMLIITVMYIGDL